MNEDFYQYALNRIETISDAELAMIGRTYGFSLTSKVVQSRNKREGYYAGYYRPHWDYAKKEKRRHRRWSKFEMQEFYPSIYGKPWRV